MVKDRILPLNNKPVSGDCVVYVMSRDQRIQDNHALIAAQATAVESGVPLRVVFNLRPKLGVRSYEHFAFMLTGLEELERGLTKYRIPFSLVSTGTGDEFKELLRQLKPAAVYFDFSPLTQPRNLAKRIAQALDCRVAVVDTHNVIPAWRLSDKQEFAARTIRPKVHRLLARYLQEPPKLQKQTTQPETSVPSLSFEAAWKQIEQLPKSHVQVTATPGSQAALAHLQHFIKQVLPTYASGRNDISQDQQSGLSPYLHFGQLSSLRVALEVLQTVHEAPLLFEQARMPEAGPSPSPADGMNALFEEMIVRKELSDNFCLYSSSYTTLAAAPEWAQKALKAHARDERMFLYPYEQLSEAKTHDETWNAAQRQMTRTGKMHGYMRMYWAKKILEWSPDADTALRYAIRLNDHYSIDGGDPNGYVGILWSIAGLHDRPWTERSIFGTVRYMNETGLRRKFDVDAYIKEWGSND